MCVIGEGDDNFEHVCTCALDVDPAYQAVPSHAMRLDAMRCDAMRPSSSLLFLTATGAMLLSAGRAACRRRSKLTWWRRAEQSVACMAMACFARSPIARAGPMSDGDGFLSETLSYHTDNGTGAGYTVSLYETSKDASDECAATAATCQRRT